MKSFIDQGGRKLNIGGDIQVNNINYYVILISTTTSKNP